MSEVGRPAWIPTPEICAEVEVLAEQGLTIEQIARSLGIGEATIYNKKREYPELVEALANGKAKGISAITNALFIKAKAGDNTSMIFYLKNRDRENWGEHTESHPANINLTINRPDRS